MISQIAQIIERLSGDPVAASLLLGDVVATVLVGLGIVLETPDNPTLRQKIALALVVIGVIGETICSVWLFDHDGSIIRSQQREIIALRATGNRLASENFMLARVMMPRRIPFENPVRLLETVRKVCPTLDSFKGTPIFLQPLPESEPIKFTRDISALTGLSKWEPSIVNHGLIRFSPQEILPGVRVWASPSAQSSLKPGSPRQDNSRELAAARILAACLNGLLGPGSAYDQGDLAPPDMPFGEAQPSPSPQPRGVIVLVGENPMAERISAMESAIVAGHP